jgi:hypothetical protein
MEDVGAPLGGPDSGRRADIAVRRTAAVKLKLKGLTWDEVAEECGYGSGAAACVDIGRFREQQNKITQAGMEELRAQALERIDALQAAFWDKAMNGDERAAAIVLKAFERRAKTEGTDAPQDMRMVLEQRTDMEASQVVEAILAAADAVDLPADVRMRMLEAAQQRLVAQSRRSDANVIEGEVVSDDG